jgi:hypothetical protein
MSLSLIAQTCVPVLPVTSSRQSFNLAAAAGFLVLAAWPSALWAQRPDTISKPSADTGRLVQWVVLERHDIFDSTESTPLIRSIANKLHIRTRQRVVERELLVQPGEPMDSARAAETGRNLRRLQVFRNVTVDSSADGRTLRVSTYDGWTTKPYANFRSTGGQRLFSIGMLETNLFGLAATLDARYQQDPDRSQLRFAFGAPRVLSNRVSTGVFYNRLSDGRSAGGAIELPYFSLSSRNAARVSFVNFDGRVLRFRDGFRVPSDSLNRRFALGSVVVSHALKASPRGYVRLTGAMQYRRDDFEPRRGTSTAFPRSNTGALLGYVDLSRADYVVARNYRMMGRPEDVDLSSTVRLGVSLAPSALGYARTGVGPVAFAQTGVRIPHGFLVVAGSVTGLASAGAIDSGTASVEATVVLQPSPRQTLVAHSTVSIEDNPYPGEEFDLGFSRGPRGFPLHAFTGDRQRFTMLEYRYTALPSVGGSFAAGIAAFAETGGAWYHGSRARDGKDVGVGLRLAPLRDAANRGATRMDVVWRFATDRERGGWLFVLGSGFPFDALR